MKMICITRAVEAGVHVRHDSIITYVTNTPDLNVAISEAFQNVIDVVNQWFPFTDYLMSVTVSEITPPQAITDDTVIFEDVFCPLTDVRPYLLYLT